MIATIFGIIGYISVRLCLPDPEQFQVVDQVMSCLVWEQNKPGPPLSHVPWMQAYIYVLTVLV